MLLPRRRAIAKTRVAIPASSPRQRAALLTAVLGFFVVALDAQIVNVALPEIRASLVGGLSGLQWVVTGYTLMFASLQLFAGTFADRSGSRQAYRIGMIVFVAASAACAVAPTLPHPSPIQASLAHAVAGSLRSRMAVSGGSGLTHADIGI